MMKWYRGLDDLQQLRVRSALWVSGVVFTAVICALILGGCFGRKAEVSTTAAIPFAVQSYEVPIADTSVIPDMLCLRPGQSAVVLQNAVITARIPVQGDELYTGPVLIERGTLVIKPQAE